VVVYAKARAVTDEAEKKEALKQSVERLSAGRSAELRKPSEAELRGTLVLTFPIAEASAKSRFGGRWTDPDDYGLRCGRGDSLQDRLFRRRRGHQHPTAGVTLPHLPLTR
jgi:hypothetical protein